MTSADTIRDEHTSSTRYDIVDEIGRGGMATVYRAVDTRAQIDVALKVLHRHLARDEAVREAFLREAKLLRRIEHRAVVDVYETTEIDGRPAFAMQLLEGGDLRHVIGRRGAISEERALELMTPILEALAHVHAEGIIHRDIKPHNIVLDADDNPHLIDFGIGQCDEAIAAHADAQLGTVEYMAPERIDELAIDGRADLYGVAITFFELVCGHVPYRADSPSEVMRMHREAEPSDPRVFAADVSDAVAEALICAMARHPQDRFDDANQMLEALRGNTASPPDFGEHPRWERLRRKRNSRMEMTTGEGEDEWIVFISSAAGKPMAGTRGFERGYRALRSLTDTYREYRTGPELPPMYPQFPGTKAIASVAGVDPDDLSSQSVSSRAARQWNALFRHRAVARGLSEQGAELIENRLDDLKLPVCRARRSDSTGIKNLLAWFYPSCATQFFGSIALISWGILMMGFLLRAEGNVLPSPALEFVLFAVAVSTAIFLVFWTWRINLREWWVSRHSNRVLLDFRRPRQFVDTQHLVEEKHLELANQIQSPRIRASYERLLNTLLHLRDRFREHDTDADERLRFAVDEATELAAAIVDAEATVAAVRPGHIVEQIDQLDARIEGLDDIDDIDVLIEKKRDLQRELKARDDVVQTLQTLAQRLLEMASSTRDALITAQQWSDQQNRVLDLDISLDFGAGHHQLHRAVEEFEALRQRVDEPH